MQDDKIIVVKYPELVKYYIEIGLCSPGTPHLPYATEEDVRGKHVYGIVPVYLASLAKSVTEVPVLAGNKIARVMSDVNLIRQYAKPPKRYVIRNTTVVYCDEVVKDNFGNR